MMIFEGGIPIPTRLKVALAPTDGKGQADAVEVHSPSSPTAASSAWGGSLRLLSGGRILPLLLLSRRCILSLRLGLRAIGRLSVAPARTRHIVSVVPTHAWLLAADDIPPWSLAAARTRVSAVAISTSHVPVRSPVSGDTAGITAVKGPSPIVQIPCAPRVSIKLAVHTCVSCSLIANYGTLSYVAAVIRNVSVVNASVNIDIPIAVIDVDAPVHIDVAAIDSDPAGPGPTVIVRSGWAVVTVIVVIAIEPRSDRKPRRERQGTDRDCLACGNAALLFINRSLLHVNGFRIVLRNVDHLGLGRFKPYYVVLFDHGHLRRRNKIARIAGLKPQPLDGAVDILRLAYERLAERRRPIEVVRHGFQHRRVVRDRLYAHVPVLIRDQAVIRTPVQGPLSFGQLVDERSSGQHLRKDRVWIQGDGGQYLVKLLSV